MDLAVQESPGSDPRRGTSKRDLVLLYDGLCGFCNGTVRFVLKRDRFGALRFAPLQGAFAATVLTRHPRLRATDSLVLVDQTDPEIERIAVRSEAVLGIAAYLGGIWRAALAARLVPRVARDWAYDLFARFRYRVFGRYHSCPVPPADERARFLD